MLSRRKKSQQELLSGENFLELLLNLVRREGENFVNGTLLFTLNPSCLAYLNAIFAQYERTGKFRRFNSKDITPLALDSLYNLFCRLPNLKLEPTNPQLPNAVRREKADLRVFAGLKHLHLQQLHPQCVVDRSALARRLESLTVAQALSGSVSEVLVLVPQAEWQSLRALDLSRNELLSSDDSINKWATNLTSLNLARNSLRSICDLRECVCLTSLDLSRNKIVEVNDAAIRLGGIVRLSLRGNQIDSTAGLQYLKNLEVLDLRDNFITHFDDVRLLAKLPLLRDLGLEGNPVALKQEYRDSTLRTFLVDVAREFGDTFVLDGREPTHSEWDEIQSLLARRPVERAQSIVVSLDTSRSRRLEGASDARSVPHTRPILVSPAPPQQPAGPRHSGATAQAKSWAPQRGGVAARSASSSGAASASPGGAPRISNASSADGAEAGAAEGGRAPARKQHGKKKKKKKKRAAVIAESGASTSASPMDPSLQHTAEEDKDASEFASKVRQIHDEGGTRWLVILDELQKAEEQSASAPRLNVPSGGSAPTTPQKSASAASPSKGALTTPRRKVSGKRKHRRKRSKVRAELFPGANNGAEDGAIAVKEKRSSLLRKSVQAKKIKRPLRITIRCSNLISKEHRSAPSCFAVIYCAALDPLSEWREAGRTRVLKRQGDPEWSTAVTLDAHKPQEVRLRCDVMEASSAGAGPIRLGQAFCLLSNVLNCATDWSSSLSEDGLGSALLILHAEWPAQVACHCCSSEEHSAEVACSICDVMTCSRCLSDGVCHLCSRDDSKCPLIEGEKAEEQSSEHAAKSEEASAAVTESEEKQKSEERQPISLRASLMVPEQNRVPLEEMARAEQPVELVISCTELANMDTFSLSDPMVVVSSRFDYAVAKFREVGRTEMIKDNLNPVFRNYHIEVPTVNAASTLLRFDVYDIDKMGAPLEKQDFIGRAECRLLDILRAVEGKWTGRLVLAAKLSSKRGFVHVGYEWTADPNVLDGECLCCSQASQVFACCLCSRLVCAACCKKRTCHKCRGMRMCPKKSAQGLRSSSQVQLGGGVSVGRPAGEDSAAKKRQESEKQLRQKEEQEEEEKRRLQEERAREAREQQERKKEEQRRREEAALLEQEKREREQRRLSAQQASASAAISIPREGGAKVQQRPHSAGESEEEEASGAADKRAYAATAPSRNSTLGVPERSLLDTPGSPSRAGLAGVKAEYVVKTRNKRTGEFDLMRIVLHQADHILEIDAETGKTVVTLNVSDLSDVHYVEAPEAGGEAIVKLSFVPRLRASVKTQRKADYYYMMEEGDAEEFLALAQEALQDNQHVQRAARQLKCTECETIFVPHDEHDEHSNSNHAQRCPQCDSSFLVRYDRSNSAADEVRRRRASTLGKSAASGEARENAALHQQQQQQQQQQQTQQQQEEQAVRIVKKDDSLSHLSVLRLPVDVRGEDLDHRLDVQFKLKVLEGGSSERILMLSRSALLPYGTAPDEEEEIWMLLTTRYVYFMTHDVSKEEIAEGRWGLSVRHAIRLGSLDGIVFGFFHSFLRFDLDAEVAYTVMLRDHERTHRLLHLLRETIGDPQEAESSDLRVEHRNDVAMHHIKFEVFQRDGERLQAYAMGFRKEVRQILWSTTEELQPRTFVLSDDAIYVCSEDYSLWPPPLNGATPTSRQFVVELRQPISDVNGLDPDAGDAEEIALVLDKESDSVQSDKLVIRIPGQFERAHFLKKLSALWKKEYGVALT